MANTIQNIHRNVMRRVYYTYALRLALHPATSHVLLLAIFGFALKQLVHVAMVYKVIVQTEVSQLLPTLANIVLHADVLTLSVLGLCIFTLLSLRIQLRHVHIPMPWMSHKSVA